MKKKLLSITAIILTAGIFVFTGCQKDDVTAPVVTLNGAETMTISLNSSFTDPGATATDDKDGSITPTPSGSVNKDKTGTYTITYSATDAAGNEGTATRTVIVKNDAEIYAGTYTSTNPDFGKDSIWLQKITASQTTSNAIVFEKFANRTGNNTITATLVGGTAFKILPATVTPQSGGCTYKYTDNGVGVAVVKLPGTGKYYFTLKYFEERVAGGTGCPAVAATPFSEKFLQQ